MPVASSKRLVPGGVREIAPQRPRECLVAAALGVSRGWARFGPG
jgi:hypothetical protein